MKILGENDLDLVRISFGYKSITFTDTTVDEVFNLALSIFRNVKITASIELKDHSVLKKPHTSANLLMTVREEGSKFRASGNKGKSKNKTLYGISDEHAIEIFKSNL